MWQHVELSEQIRPWDTLACCWDVKQPTNNKQTDPRLSGHPITQTSWRTHPTLKSTITYWTKFPDGSTPSGDSIEKRSAFKDAITTAAKEALGPKTRIHHERFDENGESIQAALDAKVKAFTEWQNDPTSVTKKTKFKKNWTRVQSELRDPVALLCCLQTAQSRPKPR